MARDRTNPISVILVSSGSRGNKLLFRYPFQRKTKQQTASTCRRNRFAIVCAGEVEEQEGDCSESCLLTDEQLVNGFSDTILATILAPKSELCGKKFELKVDDVRFVGHATLLQHENSSQACKADPSPKREVPTMILFNVVFALRAHADPSLIGYVHTLSRRLALALRREEWRCQYLTREAKVMLAAQDELGAHDGESPFQDVLPKSKLARDLKEIYDNLCSTGLVQLYINNWLEVSFCLPHKVHKVESGHVSPESISRSLGNIRPYHALLLLGECKSLLSELPPDVSPALSRLIKITTPMKTLQQLALDSDLALEQVCQLASHLVYWGKANIIFPLCESNVYMLSPTADTYVYSEHAENFSQQFPGHDLPSILAEFSLPTPLVEHRNPLANPDQQAHLAHMVVWLLQRRLLIQLHTYVCLMVPDAGESDGTSGTVCRPPAFMECGPSTQEARATGVPNTLPVGSPSSGDDLTLASPVTEVTSTEASSAELGLGGEDSPLGAGAYENPLSALTEHERRCILSVPAAQNQDDLRLFTRLLPYFCGRQHLEDVMYHENVRRSQLLTLLDKFRGVLAIRTHEDPALPALHCLPS
uniref:GATOR1 complex protein NPRL3 isoform X2 n=1 Tax=Myxine glutinosa TaxID=7769 RepID=UPI00358F6E28